ncbi:hypothetical protein Pcinc_037691 [Petrolisthes cinctipes]|uniref:Uncharacterized protein n=1 Tax=Petrolisthes cinctipes TaxID=88211 RepID=A0AAE1BS35_PETCI|nr:hypothetical protein Pcinc_037691 [Petrolisthes cinctipes]
MKLKGGLKRAPWRRKASPSPPSHHPLTPRDGHSPTRRVDPAVYNELVTPRNPTLGLGTPDKSQILYSGPPVVVAAGEEAKGTHYNYDDPHRLPVSVYYDSYGDAIFEEARHKCEGRTGRVGQRDKRRHVPAAGSRSRGGHGEGKAEGWEGEECITYYDKCPPEKPPSYYWEESQVPGRGGQIGEQDNKDPLLVYWGEEQGGGRGMYPPPLPYYSLMTLQQTTCYIDPRHMMWASLCAVCEGVEWTGVDEKWAGDGEMWAGVGEVGGVCECRGTNTGEAHQCVGTCVTCCADRSCASLPAHHDRGHERRCRVRHKQRHRKHATEDNMKGRQKQGKPREVSGKRSSGEAVSCTVKVCDRQGKAVPLASTTPAGATLPCHTAPHTLTRIDYDNLRNDWHEEIEVVLSHMKERQEVAPPQPQHQPTDSSLFRQSRPQKASLGRRSVVAGAEGRRGEGAWPGGPHGQGSGTCGAAGQAGPPLPVSVRALPRAHVRPTPVSLTPGVTSANSASVRRRSNGAVRRAKSVSERSVSVSGASETWPLPQDGVCEGECTCDMPCKVSGIPVYQGRGGDPPRNPREDVPPAAPPGTAAGRGRGATRRGGSSNNNSNRVLSSSNRSSTLVSRRGSFGSSGSPRGSSTQDNSVVDMQRRSSLPGAAGGAQGSDHTRSAPSSSISHRPRMSPSPSTRSPARGTSPSLTSRPPSPAGPGRTPTVGRRRELPSDVRTPPSTPLARRPPPRAVYQVRLSPGAALRDSPPIHRDKTASKLPVVSPSKAGKSDSLTGGGSRSFPPRPGSTSARTAAGLRAGKDTEKEVITTEDSRSVDQTEYSSLKLDTPPKSRPLSLSLNSPESPEGKMGSGNSSGNTSLDLSAASGTAATDSDNSTRPASLLPGKSTIATRSNSMISMSRSSNSLKNAGLVRSDSNKYSSNSSGGRVTPGRRTLSDASRSSNTSRLDRALSASSTQITPKVSLTRTYSGTKSSLVSGDSANRARIVRRVMSGSRTNLSKKKSNSKTSLVVGRCNLYNRTKSGSKNSLLGSRNNLFRASLDSQRTESTTDSGCNSPLYGSQGSLDSDRKRHSSSPCSKQGSKAFLSTTRHSRLDSAKFGRRDIINARMENKEHKTENKSKLTKPSSSHLTSDKKTTLSADIARPSSTEKSLGTFSGSHRAVNEATSGCTRGDTSSQKVSKLNTTHVYSARSTHLLDKVSKSNSVPVKRSVSLQFPKVTQGAVCDNLSTSCDLRPSRSSSRLVWEEENNDRRIVPGINVSFKSVSNSFPNPLPPDATLPPTNPLKGKKEITKVSIVTEEKSREEKGIQVEASSSEDENDDDDDDDDEEYERDEVVSDERASINHNHHQNEGETEENQPDGPEEEVEVEGEVEVKEGDEEEVVVDEEKEMEEEEEMEMEGQEVLEAKVTTESIHTPPSGTDNGITDEVERKKSVVHVSSNLEEDEAPRETDRQREDTEDEEGTRESKNDEGGDEGEGEEENHLIQRLETSLADIIDSTVLKNLKINGNILTDQFDAIIATLKKVAASVDSGGTDSPPLHRRNSECGVKGAAKAPSVFPAPTTLSCSSSRTPPTTKTPLSLFSINEYHPGPAGTPPLQPRNRKLSLPRDCLQDTSPSLGDLARRLHANSNHLRADQDYVEFMDLDQPYVSPVPVVGVSTADLIKGDPSPKCYGRKNSTGSLGLSSCASLLKDKSYYTGTTTASVTNLNSSEDYSTVLGSHQSSFRKVHSTSNVNGSGSGGPHRLFQRHLSLCGPDDVYADTRLRKSLSKSRELLSQLEHEYKRIKGDENKSGRNSLVIDQAWLDKDFDELLQTLSSDQSLHADPHQTLAFLTNNTTTSSTAASAGKSDKWRGSRKEAPPLPQADSPRPRRHQTQTGAEGRHIFSFFQKKGRSHSLSGTEAIKIGLPATPEDDFHEGHSRGASRVSYDSVALDRPARTNRSNSIPAVVPQGLPGVSPLDLVALLKRNRSKSVSKAAAAAGKEQEELSQPREEEEEEVAAGGGEEEDEPAKQMRSLSLPKSFLSDKYGLTGFKAALPSLPSSPLPASSTHAGGDVRSYL